jgi:molybdate transport repressor ModE-like protein
MLNLSVRSLQVFVAVAESGSFVAAADRLGITQPSVSDHIRSLEARSRTQLVERRRGRAGQLTEAGLALLAHARALLSHASDLSDDLSGRSQSASQQVVLACQPAVASLLLPPCLAGFARDHPAADLATLAVDTDAVVQHLLKGTADVGCLLAPEALPSLPSNVIGHETFVIVAAPTHPLAGRAAVPPCEVARHQFVRATHRLGFGPQMNAMLASAGIADAPVVARATESAVVRAMAMAGVGMLCTLSRAVEREVASGLLTVIRMTGDPMRMELRLAHTPSRRPGDMALRLMRHVSAHFATPSIEQAPSPAHESR